MMPGERALTDGERWARAELEALRVARFSPPAIGRFLIASSRRSAEARAARPELAQQSQRWMAIGAIAWTVPALGGFEPWRSRWRAGAAWWGLTALMLDWHLGMLETEAGQPRPLGPADALTLARAWLVPVVAHQPTALACGAGALSDVLDGQLARRGTPTRAGRDLEGLVDACFTLAALRGARRCEQLARPAALAETARLLAGTLYSSLIYFGRAEPPQRGLLGAARGTSILRASGLIAAGAGRRRQASLLLGAGTVLGLAALSAALLDSRRRPGAPPA